MEIRRVQMTGGSSFIITLPKEWIKKLNIAKNDPIGLIQQPDGSLLITPKMDKERAKQTIEFTIEDDINTNFLFRKLIGAYISGYDSIFINFKSRIQPKTRSTIRNFIQTTIGQEIVEETNTKVIIKDLLNPSEMPLDRTIKRMHIIIKGMFEDAIRSIKENNKLLSEDIYIRDSEIDRLHWLIARQHRIILNNVNFIEKMGINTNTATTGYLISRILERIGDHIVRIANESITLQDKKISETLITKIETAGKYSINLLNKSIGSFSKRELKSANDTIEKSHKLHELCEEIDTISLTQEVPIAISIGYIIESIRRIGEYSEDISETVMNHLIGSEKK
jgi:phosphate uptake regulator